MHLTQWIAILSTSQTKRFSEVAKRQPFSCWIYGGNNQTAKIERILLVVAIIKSSSVLHRHATDRKPEWSLKIRTRNLFARSAKHDSICLKLTGQ